MSFSLLSSNLILLPYFSSIPYLPQLGSGYPYCISTLTQQCSKTKHKCIALHCMVNLASQVSSHHTDMILLSTKVKSSQIKSSTLHLLKERDNRTRDDDNAKQVTRQTQESHIYVVSIHGFESFFRSWLG